MKNIIISGKQLEITKSIKDYVEEKISKIFKYTDDIKEVRVVLSTDIRKFESDAQIVDTTIYLKKETIKLRTENKDLYASIDTMADKAERQVRKYKEKQQDKKYYKATKDNPNEIVDKHLDIKEN